MARRDTRRQLLARVSVRRERLRAAKEAYDEAIAEAVEAGITPTELAQDAGVSNRVWVYAALRRARPEQQELADGAG